MEMTDYDILRFTDQVNKLRDETIGILWNKISPEAGSYYIEDGSDGTPYCFEYGYDSVKELYDLFAKFLSFNDDELIRACIAACYKYEFCKPDMEYNGEISEFIYEF